MRGKSLSVSKLEGYSVAKKVETKLPTQILERISEVNVLCVLIVIPIGFVFLFLSVLALIFFLINLLVLWVLSFLVVNIFKMNFSLVFKGRESAPFENSSSSKQRVAEKLLYSSKRC